MFMLISCSSEWITFYRRNQYQRKIIMQFLDAMNCRQCVYVIQIYCIVCCILGLITTVCWDFFALSFDDRVPYQ